MKISIIVPIYNKSSYLKALLKDILNQTFTDFECILVDDGSQDGSGKICDDISCIDTRFQTFHLENSGVSNARNLGLSKAQGTYITFVDADDRLYPEFLENLYSCMRENKVDMVISGIEKYWTDKTEKVHIKMPFVGKMEKKHIMPKFAEVQQNTGIFGFCVAKMFERSIVEDVRFDSELVLAEDFDFYLKIYRKINTFYFDDKCYYRYLQCAENSTGITKDDEIDYLAQLRINLRYKDFLIKEGFYTGESKRILEEQISNYVYYVLIHGCCEDLYNRYMEVNNLLSYKEIDLKGSSLLQKWILFWLKKNQYTCIEVTLILRKKIRKFVHSSKQAIRISLRL